MLPAYKKRGVKRGAQCYVHATNLDGLEQLQDESWLPSDS